MPDDSRGRFRPQSGDYPKDYRGLFPTARGCEFTKNCSLFAAYALNYLWAAFVFLSQFDSMENVHRLQKSTRLAANRTLEI
jgi:hypothetical protein